MFPQMLRAISITFACILVAVLAFSGVATPGFATGCSKAQGYSEHLMSSEHSPSGEPCCPDPASHSRIPCAAVTSCGAASCLAGMENSVQQLVGLLSGDVNVLPPDDLRLAEWKLPPPMEPPRLFG
jgi:hypothetical protein